MERARDAGSRDGRRRGRCRRLRALVGTFLFFLGLYAFTQSGRFHVVDEYETYFVAESILDRGSIDISQAEGSDAFFGKRGPDGRLHAPYGIGQPLLTLPFLAAGKLVSSVLPRPRPDDRFWLWFSSGMACAFYSACAVVLFQLWLLGSGLSLARATGAALLLGAGTLLWVYAGEYRSNTMVLAVLMALLAGSRLRGLLGGITLAALACIGVLVRTDALIGVALLGLFMAWEPLVRGRIGALLVRVAPVAAGAAIGIAATLVLNHVRFGSAFDAGYPPTDDLGRPAYRFGAPDPVALLALLASPGKGLLLLSPLLLLAVLRLPALLRSSPRIGILVLAMAGSHLLVFSAWQHYEGGWCFGPRFLLPVIPFLLLPLILRPVRRLWTLGAFLAGVAVNLLGLSVNYLAVARAGGYYLNLEDPLRPLSYNVFHNPLPLLLAEAARGWHDLVSGAFVSASPGTGLDFWWTFAVAESIPPETVAQIAGAQIAVFVAGAALIGRVWQGTGGRESGGSLVEEGLSAAAIRV